jgi:3-hydroxyisobutyrate dehydrogenase-like beta-hydroxyacid dehydrogenase
MKTLGILHPGEMGASIAASAQKSGCAVYWLSEGRSEATRLRAEQLGLIDNPDLPTLCSECELITSVCPPHAAEEVFDHVLSTGYQGLYLDANAIAPQKARRMAGKAMSKGVKFVDGGIIGGPAWQPGQTWLYLSGEQASEVAGWFSAGPLEVSLLSQEPGDASGLKMLYAAWTKGTTALLSVIVAGAHAMDVWPALKTQWERDWPGLAEESTRRTQGVTAKAWRFAGEMEEIAATLYDVNLPAGFHHAAAQVYRRLACFKDASSRPTLEAVIEKLLAGESDGSSV